MKWHQHQEPRIAGHPVEGVLVAEQHEDVARPQPAEVDLFQGAAHELRARRHHRLYEARGGIGPLVTSAGSVGLILLHGVPLDSRLLADGDDLVRRRPHEEDIAGLKGVAPERAPELAAVAHEPGHPQLGTRIGLHLVHRLPEQW